MTRPPRFEGAFPPIDGGGGTTALPAPSKVAWASERCSLTGNCGAGATIALWPIFMSPHLRLEAVSTLGGGATIAGDGPCKVRAAEAAFSSGAGATTDDGRAGSFISTFAFEVAARGAAGCTPDQATMLGSGTS